MEARAPDFRRYLNIRTSFGPSFSADGRRLSFLTNVTGVPQVWAVDVGGGWPDQLTFYADRVSSAEHAPIGDYLIFAMDSGGDEHHQLYLLSREADGDGAEVRPLTAMPGAIHHFGGWARDGRRFSFSANRREVVHFDVYVQDALDAAAHDARLVYQGEGVNDPVAWSRDGRALVVSHATTLLDDDLYLVGLDGGDVRHLTPHEGQARFLDPVFSADGEGLYLLTDRDRDTMAPAYLDLASLEVRLLEESAWDVEHLALSPDGRQLATSTNVDGYSELAIRDLATDRVRKAEIPEGVVLDLKWSPDGGTLAFSISGPTRNADVWLVRPTHDGNASARPAATRLTRSARGGLAESSFVAPSLVRYTTFDGREIPAFFYRPRVESLGAPAPVIVSVHGGPEGQELPAFNPIYQYFLARGYGIFAPNVRGSTGYGKAYTHLDDVRLRMDSVRDLEAGWRWLGENGADPKRIGIMGGSYGGFMVLAAVTTYPDLWAAAVDIVGIANFITFLENTGPWRRKLREAEYGSLEADRDFLTEISPIHKVDRIRAPLMVIHGANDPRVPVGEAEQIVEGIRRRGGVVGYLRFEDEGHGLVRLPNRIAAYTRIGQFLDQHLAGRQT